MKTLRLTLLIIFVSHLAKAAELRNSSLGTSILDPSKHSLTTDKSITDIDLSKNNLTLIVSTYFTDFPSLRKLRLDENRHFNLPRDEIFLESASLEVFSCVKCGITRVSEASFSRIPALTQLFLTGNLINYVDSAAFMRNSKLYALNLARNRLTTVNEEGRLFHMESLMMFVLNENPGLRIKPGLNTRTLKSLELFGCGIKEIGEDLFKGFPNLYKLRLDYNEIERFDRSAFRNNRLALLNLTGNPLKEFSLSGDHLKEFFCNDCNVTELRKDMLEGAKNLKKLELKRNLIEEIEADTFDSNSELERIRLEGNRLTYFPGEILDRLPKLSLLCLDENPFIPSYENTILKQKYTLKKIRNGCFSTTKFEDELPNIDILGGKVLYGKRDTNIPAIYLGILDYSNQDIIYVDKNYFSSDSNLQVLTMDGNSRLTFRPSEVFLNHQTLQEFNCRNCSIDAVHKQTFSRLPSLIQLDLSLNSIIQISNNAFIGNPELQNLILDSNNITYLSPKAIDSAKKLTYLSLNYQEQFDFEPNRIFLYHGSLQKLSLYHCSITRVWRDTLLRLPNLREIDLSYNQIEAIEPAAFDANINLKQINLDGNLLKTFSVDFIKPLTLLRELCLDRNEPFDFEPNEENLKLKNYYKKKDLRTPRCEDTETGLERWEEKIIGEIVNPTEWTPTEDSLSKQLFMNLESIPVPIENPYEENEKEMDFGISDNLDIVDYPEEEPLEINQKGNFMLSDDSGIDEMENSNDTKIVGMAGNPFLGSDASKMQFMSLFWFITIIVGNFII